MTAEEMECCKKMAGNCDMGGGNHKCCGTAVKNFASEVALLHNSTFDLQITFAVAPILQPVVLEPQVLQGSFTTFVSPSPPLLSLFAVLRI